MGQRRGKLTEKQRKFLYASGVIDEKGRTIKGQEQNKRDLKAGYRLKKNASFYNQGDLKKFKKHRKRTKQGALAGMAVGAAGGYGLTRKLKSRGLRSRSTKASVIGMGALLGGYAVARARRGGERKIARNMRVSPGFKLQSDAGGSFGKKRLGNRNHPFRKKKY